MLRQWQRTFGLKSQSYPTGDRPNAIAVADFNADGIPDLVIANSNDSRERRRYDVGRQWRRDVHSRDGLTFNGNDPLALGIGDSTAMACPMLLALAPAPFLA